MLVINEYSLLHQKYHAVMTGIQIRYCEKKQLKTPWISPNVFAGSLSMLVHSLLPKPPWSCSADTWGESLQITAS